MQCMRVQHICVCVKCIQRMHRNIFCSIIPSILTFACTYTFCNAKNMPFKKTRCTFMIFGWFRSHTHRMPITTFLLKKSIKIYSGYENTHINNGWAFFDGNLLAVQMISKVEKKSVRFGISNAQKSSLVQFSSSSNKTVQQNSKFSRQRCSSMSIVRLSNWLI